MTVRVLTSAVTDEKLDTRRVPRRCWLDALLLGGLLPPEGRLSLKPLESMDNEEAIEGESMDAEGERHRVVGGERSE
jgi:hypothetical protein